MVQPYRIRCGYDQEDVANFMKRLHEHNSRTGSFQFLDFTLTTFWGEAAEKAGLASARRYLLLEEGDPIGLFQGLVQKKLLYKSMRAGSTSGNGILMFPGFSKSVMSLFLLRVLGREAFSASLIFTPVSPDIPSFSEKTNYTLYIYLDRDMNEICRNMKKKTRNRVKKARKLGVTVDFSDSVEALKTAYDVITSTATSRGVLALPWRYVLGLHECFRGRGCESVVALGYESGEDILSVAHLFGFDRKLVLWQAGSTEKGYKLNAGSLIQAEVIEWAKNTGYLVYDMGGTDPQNPIYAGIHRFKSGFGGSLIANKIIEKNAFFVPLLRSAFNFFGNIQTRLL